MNIGDMIEADKIGYNYVFQFGKYKSLLVTEVLETDPQYILWAAENVSHFSPTEEVLAEARFACDVNIDEIEDWMPSFPKD